MPKWIEVHRLHLSLATQAAFALLGGVPEEQTLSREDKNRMKSSIARRLLGTQHFL